MIKAKEFLDLCKEQEYTFFSGTPCSYLKPIINTVIDDSQVEYIGATNEGDAVSMVCGAYAAHRKGVAMFQNSGLCNAINALTSLSYPFQIPFLMIVTHRGQPGGPPDEPQHIQMGAITEELLTTLDIKWEYFPDQSENLRPAFARAEEHMETTKRPFAFIMRTGSVAPQILQQKKSDLAIGPRTIKFSESIDLPYSARSTRTDALKVVLKYQTPADIIIATTGKTGRELFTLEDKDSSFYMVGSMGSASSFALGVALNACHKRLITIDGDAALLMRMGNLATIGDLQPPNFLHLVLDNEVNDSTGGQATVSANIPLAVIAEACGYRHIYSTDQLNDLDKILTECLTSRGPVFIHFRIRKGSPKDLGRPKVKPPEVKERLMRLLAQ